MIRACLKRGSARRSFQMRPIRLARVRPCCCGHPERTCDASPGGFRFERAIHPCRHWNHTSCAVDGLRERPIENVPRQEFQESERCPEYGGLGFGERTQMPTVEQCRAYAAEHKQLANDGRSSVRRCTVHKNISHSWVALAHQMESLADIVKSEGKPVPSLPSAPRCPED